jgi:two-component SAPR family response regulator
LTLCVNYLYLQLNFLTTHNKTKNKHLEETASSVSERLNKLEQSSHCNDLIISGIPVLEKEGLTTLNVVEKFVNQINIIKISNQDIRSANRIIPRNIPYLDDMKSGIYGKPIDSII